MQRIVLPKIVNIEVTTFCPYQCPQCYKINQNILEGRMDIQDYKAVIDEVAELGCKKILISGGEPFVYEYLLEAVEYVKKSNMETYISTGGFGSTGTLIEKLKRSGLNALYVSLNGSNREVNKLSRQGFENAISVLEDCKDKKLPARINWVARKDNYLDFINILDLAEKMNVEQIDILKNKPDGEGNVQSELNHQELKKLAGIINEYSGSILISIESCFYELKNLCGVGSISKLLRGCSAGRYSMSINMQRHVSPCAHGFPDVAENLNTYSGIKDYWENSPIVRNFRGDKKVFSDCLSCKYSKSCEPCKLQSDNKCGLMI